VSDNFYRAISILYANGLNTRGIKDMIMVVEQEYEALQQQVTTLTEANEKLKQAIDFMYQNFSAVPEAFDHVDRLVKEAGHE